MDGQNKLFTQSKTKVVAIACVNNQRLKQLQQHVSADYTHTFKQPFWDSIVGDGIAKNVKKKIV